MLGFLPVVVPGLRSDEFFVEGRTSDLDDEDTDLDDDVEDDLDVDEDLEVDEDLDVDEDLEVDEDLDVDEPPLLACAKASDSNAVTANPTSITANVVLSVFMIKKF